jgi:hypothetical protein
LASGQKAAFSEKLLRPPHMFDMATIGPYGYASSGDHTCDLALINEPFGITSGKAHLSEVSFRRYRYFISPHESPHNAVVRRTSYIHLPRCQRPACDLPCWNDMPPRCAVLPLVIRELLDSRAVKAHYENLTVGLRRIGVHCFILEAHP